VIVELRCGDARACDQHRLARPGAALRAASDHTRACTAIYGGPERAHVSGRRRGRHVDLNVTRSNGCGIADYDALFRALAQRPPLASP
jgi:hypothetical protein